MRALLIVGALMMAAGVVSGAFGAHALRSRLDPQMLAVWQTAVQYHLIHALGMIAIAFAGWQWPHLLLSWAGWLLLAGILLFSGSLYLLALTGVRGLGAITPFGGIAFIAGWLVLAWAGAKLAAQ
jgi:uncharacterized membrane protein YgdD (TMEM256/DUF423 family)